MTRLKIHPIGKIATVIVVCMCFWGCSGGGVAKKTCYPVKGQVLIKSQPAAGAKVTLHPQNGTPEEWPSGYPHADVATDGSFEIGTYGDKVGDLFVTPLLGYSVPYGASFLIVGYLAMLHYYTEAFTWRKGSPYREHLALTA